MGVWDWLRGVFRPVGPDDEAAEREDFGLADRGASEVERDRAADFATAESADLAKSEIEALGPPPDPDP